VPNDSETREPRISRLAQPDLMVMKKGPSSVASVAEARVPAPVRIGIGGGSQHSSAFVQLYYAIEARRTNGEPLVVQFIAPSGGNGVSTVASGYARVAADDCADPVLFVDCAGFEPGRAVNSVEPPTLIEVLRHGLPLSDATMPVRDARNLCWARLGPGPRPLLSMGADRLQTLLDMLRSHHPIIVLDSPPANSPEAAALSRYCDGTVMVVQAGRTRQTDIEAAKVLIERLGGQTVGVVLNRERSVLPRWMGRRR
jgi:Mrp family chromosome partitioning ATPase